MSRRIFGGFVVPLLLALFTSLVVFQIVRAYNRNVTHVTAASRTLGDLNALIKTVIDAETGERGFAITGNETFLEPFVSSTVDFGVALSTLRGSLPDPDSRGALSEVDTLFERWQREVAGVIVQARRRTPVELSSALRGASTAFTQARVAALRYQLTGESALQSLAMTQLSEAQRQLQQALGSGIRGPGLTAVRAAMTQLETQIAGVQGAGDAQPLGGLAGAQQLDDTLTQLAADAETAEALVTALIKAGAGKEIIDEIRARVGEISDTVNGTLAETLEQSSAATQRTQWVAFIGPLFAALMSLLVILRGQRQLENSVRQLGVVVKAVAAGQLERRMSLSARDELYPLAENFNRMADRLSEREGQNAQLGDFSSTLQTCKTVEEAYEVTERFGPALFSSFSGALYRVSESRNIMNEVVSWGDESSKQTAGDAPPIYTPSDCWALRRGKPQLVDGAHGIICAHAPAPNPAKSLCAPLVTQEETLGVLYLYSRDPATALGEATERFAETVAEQLALALSNLRLRESLTQQSIRDPLTGLFNRRHLEETLDLELHRAARRNEPISAVMFDVDHFKRYNDLHGHDAGDAVLQALGGLVQRHIRAGDVACRYGGEEFLLLQPGMSAQDALGRAETLRKAVAGLSLEHHGVTLGGVTVSLGVATYPEHALGRTALLKRADEALYKAKRGGRNQVIVATPLQEAEGSLV